MEENQQQQLEEQALEQQEFQTERAAAVASKSRAFAWLAWCAVAACIVFIATLVIAVFAFFWWGKPLLNDSRHVQVASFKALEAGLPDIIQQGDQAVTHFNNVSAELDKQKAEIIKAYTAPANALTNAVNTINTETAASARSVRSEIASLQKISDNAEPHITQSMANVEDATAVIDRAAKKVEEAVNNPRYQKFVDDALGHGDSILAEVDETSGNIKLISGSGKSIAIKADGTMDQVQALAGDMETGAEHIANILGYADDKVKPKPPARGFKQKLGRGLLTFVGIVKDFSGAALVVFKIAGP